MNNINEVVFILDASGSMCDLTDDTIGGFNSMIEKEKNLPGKILVSTVSFNDDHRMLHDRVDISEVKKLTRNDYVAGGCTALLDAMGDTIRHIEDIHKYIRKEDVPGKTTFVITTDGYENASHKYSSDEIKKMVSEKKELGWEFIYMAANIDAVETGKNLGIDENRVANFIADKKGNGKVFEAAGTFLRRRVADCMPVGSDWKEDLEEDFRNRKK